MAVDLKHKLPKINVKLIHSLISSTNLLEGFNLGICVNSFVSMVVSHIQMALTIEVWLCIFEHQDLQFLFEWGDLLNLRLKHPV